MFAHFGFALMCAVASQRNKEAVDQFGRPKRAPLAKGALRCRIGRMV